jgi:hemolysin III
VTAPGVPRLRGVMHQYAAVPAVALAIVLIGLAPSARARTAAVVYGAGLCACFGMSAIYHRGRWSSRVKAALCVADHSTIFLLIAGTSTPVILLTLHGTFGTTVLVVEWAGAAAGIGIALLWRGPPVWAEVGPYLVLGWLGLLALPALVATLGPVGLALVLGGGALYTIGAVCYALERPDPWPSVFGFHEVFHGFVTAAASVHGVLITILILAV